MVFWHEGFEGYIVGTLHANPCRSLRAYPYDFGLALAKAFRQQAPVADLRGKKKQSMDLTDRELFAEAPLGDVWWDASLPSVWSYLWGNRKLSIPDSWHDTMEQFHTELMAATWLGRVCLRLHPKAKRPDSVEEYYGLK